MIGAVFGCIFGILLVAFILGALGVLTMAAVKYLKKNHRTTKDERISIRNL
ncbi:hypothetical protein [Alloscardovia macacae]|uniref:hypothetical protein n=1 Tax=Alloscardovia macacae TaxID=1160091 RepID=UPI0015D8A3D5|nr:hypothetical protein [Alloscardovia macacae]